MPYKTRVDGTDYFHCDGCGEDIRFEMSTPNQTLNESDDYPEYVEDGDEGFDGQHCRECGESL